MDKYEGYWFAVQDENYMEWDYGSYDYNEAVEMLKKQGGGQIAVIDEKHSFCVDVITFEDAVA